MCNSDKTKNLDEKKVVEVDEVASKKETKVKSKSNKEVDPRTKQGCPECGLDFCYCH